MKKLTILLLVSTVLLVSSCKKTGTITVTVKKQSIGQPIEIADAVTVLMVNTSDSLKFDLELSSAQGVAIFHNVENANYKISSQKWDGTKELYDQKIVEVKDGKSITVDLLLQ